MDRVDLRHLSRENLQVISDNSYLIGDEEYFLSKIKSRLYTVKDCTRLPRDEKLATIRPFSGTSLDAVESISQDSIKTAVLNFASGKKPGGGFLNGALAQEEDLCYRSNLYDALSRHPQFYDKKSKTYTDNIIYSQAVSIFCDRDYQFQPLYTTNVINRHICRDKDLGDQLMIKRARAILTVAEMEDVRGLVLGGWGCGVFGNQLSFVIPLFRHLLETEFQDSFQIVLFPAIDDSTYKKMSKLLS